MLAKIKWFTVINLFILNNRNYTVTFKYISNNLTSTYTLRTSDSVTENMYKHCNTQRLHILHIINMWNYIHMMVPWFGDQVVFRHGRVDTYATGVLLSSYSFTDPYLYQTDTFISLLLLSKTCMCWICKRNIRLLYYDISQIWLPASMRVYRACHSYQCVSLRSQFLHVYFIIRMQNNLKHTKMVQMYNIHVCVSNNPITCWFSEVTWKTQCQDPSWKCKL